MVAVLISSSAEFERSAELACRSLFLHFVNRELLNIRGSNYDESDHIAKIKLCGLLTGGRLVAPFAQVTELYWNRKHINALVSELCGADKLHLCNGSADRYTFVETRKALYSEHKSRYGMYFGKREITHAYRSSPGLSTTEHIKSTLLGIVNNPDRSHNLISFSEIQRLALNSRFIRNEFQENPQAATFSIYETAAIVPKPDETRFFGAISSRLFVHHYTDLHHLITPTGFFRDITLESFDHFPLFDLDLNARLFDRLGLTNVIRDVEFHKPLLNIVLDKDFQHFSRLRTIFVQALLQSVGHKVGDGMSHVYKLEARLNSLDFGGGHNGAPQQVGTLIDLLANVMTRASKSDPDFAKALESMTMQDETLRPVLMLTATDTEDRSFKAMAAIRDYKRVDIRTMPGFTASVYKGANGVEILHIRTSPGSSGAHGSARVSEAAIAQIRPAFVFSVGIAFGVDEKKQKLGDVLISEYVFSYERGKYKDGDFQWRGDNVPCSPDAVSYGRQYDFYGADFSVIPGGILSGDKLVDDEHFRTMLTKMDSRAVGGEMEASGIAQSCNVLHVPFAMLKGICDFAVGKNDNAQELAARNAFRVFFDMFEAFAKSGSFNN